jgi:hypothetical protein
MQFSDVERSNIPGPIIVSAESSVKGVKGRNGVV